MKKQLGLQKRLIIIFAIFIVTVSILQTVLAGSGITAKQSDYDCRKNRS